MGRANPEHQRILLADYPAPHLFAVLSWGCAATGWLARALNSHPDVFAVHGANSIWTMLGAGEQLTGVDYMRVLGVLGTAHAAAGDVHGVSFHEVESLRNEYGDRFSCAVVVREPLARLRSALALAARYESARAEDLSFLDPLLQEIGLDRARMSGTELSTVNIISALNNIILEQQVAPVFRAEDLTSDPDALSEFVRLLAPVPIDRSWALAAVRRAPTNSHVAHPAPGLEPSVIALLRRIIKPETRDAYRALGYPALP